MSSLPHPLDAVVHGTPVAHAPHAGHDDQSYQARYRDLKKKVKDVEQENEKLHMQVLHTKHNIQRLRLERAILYERLGVADPSQQHHQQPQQQQHHQPPPPSSSSQSSAHRQHSQSTAARSSHHQPHHPQHYHPQQHVQHVVHHRHGHTPQPQAQPPPSPHQHAAHQSHSRAYNPVVPPYPATSSSSSRHHHNHHAPRHAAPLQSSYAYPQEPHHSHPHAVPHGHGHAQQQHHPRSHSSATPRSPPEHTLPPVYTEHGARDYYDGPPSAAPDGDWQRRGSIDGRAASPVRESLPSVAAVLGERVDNRKRKRSDSPDDRDRDHDHDHDQETPEHVSIALDAEDA